jgi:hypothetical protein
MDAFDVRIHTIRRRKNKRRPFEVRWRVAGRDKSKSFLTRALADSYRAELVRAARQGLEFDPATGEPQWAVPEPTVTTWLEHAVAYADMKWPRLAPHSRASLADALATVTLALTRPASGRPPARTLRAALYRHAFNPTRRATTTDPAVARALGWLAQASLPVTQLSDPQVTRAALDALMLRLDGSRAAASTIARKRAVFHDAAGYAVELGLLPANPVSQVRWTPPKAAAAVNPQTVASPAQVRAILAEVARLRPELTAFFGCLYYAAAPRRSRSTPQRQPRPGPARAGQADPHRRLPAHRLSVDQHRHAARTALPQAPPGRSGPGRPRAGGSGRPAPAAPAQVWDRAGRAAVPRRPRRLPQRKHLRSHLARRPRDRARPAAGRHVTGLPPVRPAACRLVVVAERHRGARRGRRPRGQQRARAARRLHALHRRAGRPHQPADRRRPRPGLRHPARITMRDSKRLYAPLAPARRCPPYVRERPRAAPAWPTAFRPRIAPPSPKTPPSMTVFAAQKVSTSAVRGNWDRADLARAWPTGHSPTVCVTAPFARKSR